MNKTMKVALVAATQLLNPGAFSPDWQPEPRVSGGESLCEAAGRSCYASWTRPRPETATNAGYLAHILEVGHLSVLEHGSVTFYLTGISRSLTHELIRHRHFSYSQMSQRYVSEANAEMVMPDIIAAHPQAAEAFNIATEAAQKGYDDLVEVLTDKLGDDPAFAGKPTARRKAARQAARAVLPNATETRIVVTGNYRAWRHFVAMRATEHADVEIRELAIECLKQLHAVAPNVFADFSISTLPDGTEVAASRYAAQS